MGNALRSTTAAARAAVYTIETTHAHLAERYGVRNIDCAFTTFKAAQAVADALGHALAAHKPELRHFRVADVTPHSMSASVTYYALWGAADGCRDGIGVYSIELVEDGEEA